jgi:stearoyl-CoA desaturase (delta-9 desaturase)
MTSTTTTPARANSISWPAFLWIGSIHLGALLALNPAYFSWKALLACAFMHWLAGGIGICMCYHRLLTHRSFATRPKALEYVLTAIGCAASEGGPVGWVADHCKHHAHSDEEPDVHTPHRGFWWAHMMWWMTPDADTEHSPEYLERWAPDLNRDPVLRWFDKYHFLFPILSAVTLFLLGGMPFLVWGFFVSTVLVLHTTWLVNSATHVWGYRSHKTRDDSTNLWWVALLTYGEGWHNNHHAYQTSARHGMSWWELDMTYIGIRLLSLVGLAHSVKLPKVVPSTPEERVKHSLKVQREVPREDETELVGTSN